MNFEPQKFFIGLMDFFTILLPGALLAFLLQPVVHPWLVGQGIVLPEQGVAGWIAFLLVSYLLGHLVFLVGAWWLDDFYDWARNLTRDKQIARVVRCRRPLRWMTRAFVWVVYKRESNAAVAKAAAIKKQLLAPLAAADAINTFQWSKAWLAKESPVHLTQVQRFEADSKFFRSLTVSLLILLAVSVWQERWLLVVCGALLLPLALWRYMEQRLKATNHAYWSVITVAATTGISLPAPKLPVFSHAGGVVFRRRLGATEFLLVEATDKTDEWVLPKGHVEDGETDPIAATREVLEETGYWAAIEADFGPVAWTRNGKVENTHFFLMRAKARGVRSRPLRRRCWLSLKEALGQRKGLPYASYEDTRELLRRASTLVQQLDSGQRGRP